MSPPLHVPHDHDAVRAFDASAREDPTYKALFNADSAAIWIQTSSGMGWRVMPGTTAPAIVSSAARRILYTARDTTDLDVLLDEVVRVEEEFRTLLSGHEAPALAVTGFVGLNLAEGVRLHTPWGDLRAATEFDRSVGGRPTAIVETPVQVKYRVGKPSADEPPPQRDEQMRRRLSDLALLLPLAALLGLEHDEYPVVDWLWQTMLLPAQMSSGFSGRASTARRFRVRTDPLQRDEEDALAQWAERVQRHYHQSISIAVRRTLSAVRERVDPEDALIDAVIATESLFGHGEKTEVTFRVTTAISLILEENKAARASFKSRLGRVYDSRSKVVHGGSVKPAVLNDHKEIAISVAVRCLRELFEHHTHLIADQSRGMHLILRTSEADD
jgi:hypothetical protein